MIVAGGAQPWSARLGLGMVEERQSCRERKLPLVRFTKAIWRAHSSLLGSLRRAPHLRVRYPLTPTPAQRHLTCSSSSGGSLASPQGQSCQLSKTWETRGAAGWVSEEWCWISCSLYIFFLQRRVPASQCPPVSSAGGQRSGVRPRAQVARSLGPQFWPPSAPATGSTGGYRSLRLPLRPLLATWGRLGVHSARGSGLGLFIFLSGCRAWSSALAFPPSVQTFLLLQVSLAEAEANRALPGRPLAGLEGGGARPPWAPLGSPAGGGVRAGAGLGAGGGAAAVVFPPSELLSGSREETLGSPGAFPGNRLAAPVLGFQWGYY
ncbi:uncharacterized protein LOC112626986 [Theropithecus gelada]|uniref:uncharacterized protein LOC112626986 n=1 Tax=Theropithecus gelada TaxID=9565 RepID=UPI000DC17E37|nr:uncharacterized protein LOC112626986 [Theropithecus gelada]